MVRNSDPFFIWTCRRDTINFRFLRKETMVNHFAKNGAFTTKVRRALNLQVGLESLHGGGTVEVRFVEVPH